MMAIDITGVAISDSSQHLGMTVGLPHTINWSQSRVPFSGVVNSSMNTSPTVASTADKFIDRMDDPRYYTGDAET